MDTHPPRHEDDLTEFERRLSGWRPGDQGLNADAMLFAAGVAAGRRRRHPLLLSAACVLLVVQTIGLGLWGLTERAERRALAARSRESGVVPGSSPTTAEAASPLPAYTPSPDDYLHLRRRAELDPVRWLASLQSTDPQPPGPPPPEPVILQAGQRDHVFD
jgi:hypothetical protein